MGEENDSNCFFSVCLSVCQSACLSVNFFCLSLCLSKGGNSISDLFSFFCFLLFVCVFYFFCNVSNKTAMFFCLLFKLSLSV